MRFQLLVGTILAVLLAATGVHAAQLGVNYYHETLMNPGSNGPYIPRSISEVGQDFDNIKTIAGGVKLYMNPFVDQNLPWVQQVAAVARQKGLHVVVNMMVDDRQLDDSNWQDYSNRVVAASKALSGQVDEVIVANEITLHSPLARDNIRDKVIALEGQVQQVFNGQVSYEEFWYAKDVWKGYTGRLYWMMYEDTGTFQNNINEMQANWGSNAIVGEWGEDLLDGTTLKDEQWQKDSIQARWNIIQQTSTPYAYLFTYREPSYDAFGMLRPDGSRRPLWDVFANGASSAPSAPAPAPDPQPTQPQPAPQPAPVQQTQPTATQPVQQTQPVSPAPQPAPDPQPAPQPASVQQTAPQPAPQPAPAPAPQQAQPTTPYIVPPQSINLPLTTSGVTIQSDYTTSNSCRQITAAAQGQTVQVLACNKSDGTIEMYVQQQTSSQFAICLGNGCVTNYNGFVRFRR